MVEIELRYTAPEGVELSYAHDGDAGMDLRAWLPDFYGGTIIVPARDRMSIPTGVYADIPKGYEIQIRPRSGLAFREGISVLNSPGTIDSTYLGELCVCLFNNTDGDFYVSHGAKIAQAVLAPVIKALPQKVESLDKETTRGTAGFGSTGV